MNVGLYLTKSVDVNLSIEDIAEAFAMGSEKERAAILDAFYEVLRGDKRFYGRQINMITENLNREGEQLIIDLHSSL